jgi:large subunit ribosomal protein L2
MLIKTLPLKKKFLFIKYLDKNKKKFKKSIFFWHSKQGRNCRGKITIRHKGNGHKRLYRFIDFKRTKINTLGVVQNIEYDPNRNTNIALICYTDGTKQYILCPKNLFRFQQINSGRTVKLQIGNTLPLYAITTGTYIHNIELIPNGGGQLVRAGGTYAKILLHKKNYVIIRLPSREIRLIHKNCMATIGILSSKKFFFMSKAGRFRWLGIRPTIRGVAMNACDHPHGGGEGRSPIGRKHPVTPWGKNALGIKTRKKVSKTNFLIIKRRK